MKHYLIPIVLLISACNSDNSSDPAPETNTDTAAEVDSSTPPTTDDQDSQQSEEPGDQPPDGSSDEQTDATQDDTGDGSSTDSDTTDDVPAVSAAEICEQTGQTVRSGNILYIGEGPLAVFSEIDVVGEIEEIAWCVPRSAQASNMQIEIWPDLPHDRDYWHLEGTLDMSCVDLHDDPIRRRQGYINGMLRWTEKWEDEWVDISWAAEPACTQPEQFETVSTETIRGPDGTLVTNPFELTDVTRPQIAWALYSQVRRCLIDTHQPTAEIPAAHIVFTTGDTSEIVAEDNVIFVDHPAAVDLYETGEGTFGYLQRQIYANWLEQHFGDYRTDLDENPNASQHFASRTWQYCRYGQLDAVNLEQP